MDLIAGLAREQRMGLLLVTHDAALASKSVDRVVRLDAGRLLQG